ncbi:aspartate dehydrogenase [Alteribacillus bidgolensis]|uniref:L-aspartate dehydrogenase n=1 Tax=Alteribacillus bidgolensis TaxID=930129 RepID=A0A1G8FQK7_9BACI|nr:aspartate dehydrogenase [Alteribacillus bidgolensis]SDH84389.1 aspartate dehydrogenase [Alteribacillus bidgolensis]
MNIGIIGAGTIATFLLTEIEKQPAENLSVKSLYVRDIDKYRKLSEDCGVQLFNHFDSFLDSDIDIVIEAANITAVQELIPRALEKKEAAIISIGALSDDTFLEHIMSLANRYNHSIYLPSGAIGGMDLIQNAGALGELDEVSLTTRKPAHSLNEQSLKQEKIIFQGTAFEAIRKFPKNINVSIILSLAGVGIHQTKVTIIADPDIQTNQHKVEAKGAFGTFSSTIENNPMPSNPKTSFLAALSILGTLRKLQSDLKIGI